MIPGAFDLLAVRLAGGAQARPRTQVFLPVFTAFSGVPHGPWTAGCPSSRPWRGTSRRGILFGYTASLIGYTRPGLYTPRVSGSMGTVRTHKCLRVWTGSGWCR